MEKAKRGMGQKLKLMIPRRESRRAFLVVRARPTDLINIVKPLNLHVALFLVAGD
jgi:hypothetical protein